MPFKEQLACGSRAFYLACAYRRAHADNNSQTGCVAQFVLNIHRASVRCGLTRADLCSCGGEDKSARHSVAFVHECAVTESCAVQRCKLLAAL
uniref:DB domain-containing protein n=1 Tax=Ascaris lumbricoides TaxID=6252 RepID=A0A0M3HTA1_ASCLU